MKRLLTYTILIFLLGSCSTIINTPYTKLNVETDVDSARVQIKNTDEVYIAPVTIYTKRSRNDLYVTVSKDSLSSDYIINSKLSSWFWFGNLFNGTGIVGYGIDLTNPKRFTYPRYNYLPLSVNGKQLNPKRWMYPGKGQFDIKISIPEGNYFFLMTKDLYESKFGFLGISAGLNYYLNRKNYLNFDIGTITDFFLPFPAPVDYMGGYNRSFARYFDLQYGYDFSRFLVEFGAQFNRTLYVERETVELFPNYIDSLRYYSMNYNAGLSVGTSLRISNGFNLGLNYYPSFITWQDAKPEFHYSHLMMFEFIFKLSLNKRRYSP